MATDKKLPTDVLSGPVSPYPGDGVCPTAAQFYNTASYGYKLWSSLESETRDDPSIPCTADCILDLLRHVPAFCAQRSKAFSILNKPFPQVKYALEWVTTTDAACDQPVKRTYHYQTLGILEPLSYRFIDVSSACPYWPGIGPDRAQYISYLIFGWTYILSTRWVEILQDAEEKVSLQQSEELNHHNFWEVVAGQRWQASIIRGGNTFYAPWSLLAHEAMSRVQLSKVSPNSSSAFNIFADYCMSEGLASECVAALAIVLTLPECSDSPLLLPCLMASPKVKSTRGQKDDCYEKLFECLSSCITLSCNSGGIQSLLCSVFFEPTVPCNLIGAHLSGVENAIKPLEGHPWILAALMARKNPKISPLWLATIWSRRVSNVLTSVMGGLPPISLPVASWTETIQSFVQARHYSIINRPGFIPRAREYSVAYLIRDDVVMPFTPSPPFGETPTSNLSLEVKMHLEHDHRPILHRTSWILNTGEELPDQQGLKIMPQLNVRLPFVARKKYVEGLMLNQVDDKAGTVSSDASFNLFNWHRNNEGGLWLVEGSEDVEVIRRCNSHPWIKNDSDEDSVSENEDSEEVIDPNSIHRWRDDMVEMRY